MGLLQKQVCLSIYVDKSEECVFDIQMVIL